ncbi:alpha-amylase family glycosyl hydrolase [uncultured Sphingomonas sp.]|uniref:alpha-amylase family glycosyl hydrolase n=1 Tax=uncultured Sphingomonas sp. TaxID=158754 RepID=UPI0035CC6203
MSFAERWDRHGLRLTRELDALYGDLPGHDDFVAEVTASLKARAIDRPAPLAALDAAREADPAWFRAPEMLGYSAYVDRFGGTLAGVGDRIGYLEDLGVRYLHLLALLKARGGDSDGGFAVADYLAVEPRLGTIPDLEALTARLRGAGISLCVDFALNHTADDHEWARRARAGDPLYRDFYIVLDDAAEVAARETELGQVFPVTAPGNFTHVPDMGWVWTTFYPFQWDLNWANPRLFAAMLDMMLRLANHGVEAFRLDSIAFLWKQAGTDSRNRRQVHAIVRALRAAIDIVAPGVLLKGEAIVPTRDVIPYFGTADGPECHLLYNNSLMVAGWTALVEQSAQVPRAIQAETVRLPAAANWLTYARCHDDIGWGALLGDLTAFEADPERRLKAVAAVLEGGGFGRGESFQAEGGGLHGTNGTMASLAGLESAFDEAAATKAIARIRLLNALMIASGGLPTIYMGDEAAMLNDYRFRQDPLRAHEGRWLHRPAMDWDRGADDAAAQVHADLAALLRARVAGGGSGPSAIWATHDDAVLGLEAGKDIVLINFADRDAEVDMPFAWADRLSDATATTRAIVPPLGVLWCAAR